MKGLVKFVKTIEPVEWLIISVAMVTWIKMDYLKDRIRNIEEKIRIYY